MLEVVSAAPVYVGAEEPAAVLMGIMRVRKGRGSHPEAPVEVLSILQIIAAFNIEVSVLKS